MKKVAYCTLGFAVLFFTIKWLGISFGGNEIKRYPVQCKVDLQNGTCPIVAYTNTPTNYRVMENKQQVMDVGNLQLYTKCTIADVKNWKCSFDDNSSTFGFTNGNAWETPDYGTDELAKSVNRQYFVSRLDWINLSAKECSWPYALCYPLLVLTQ